MAAPIDPGPGVELLESENPGLPRYTPREHLGLEVTLGEVVFADSEHGVEHHFFLGAPTTRRDATPTIDANISSIILGALTSETACCCAVPASPPAERRILARRMRIGGAYPA